MKTRNRVVQQPTVLSNKSSGLPDKILRITALTASVMAILELSMAHFSIRMTRLSAVETTGIFLFAFIIFSLVTIFAVSRMKDSVGGTVFAVIMNGITALAATWYLRLLFSDTIFLRNLYYTLDRQTQTYELIPLGGRITASVPLALIILGTVVYYLCGLVIVIVSLAAGRKRQAEKPGG